MLNMQIYANMQSTKTFGEFFSKSLLRLYTSLETMRFRVLGSISAADEHVPIHAGFTTLDCVDHIQKSLGEVWLPPPADAWMASRSHSSVSGPGGGAEFYSLVTPRNCFLANVTCMFLDWSTGRDQNM